MILLSKVLESVRHIINEAATTGDDFTAETDKALVHFIELALHAMTRDLGVTAEAAEQTDNAAAQWETRPDGMKYAVIRLPENLLRFVSVRLNDWVRPVTTLHSVNSALYASQYTSSKGIGAGVCLPAAFWAGETERAIIAHSQPAAGTYALRYIPTEAISNIDNLAIASINIAAKYAAPLAYYAAALYHTSINEMTGAGAELTMAKSYLATDGVQEDNNSNNNN